MIEERTSGAGIQGSDLLQQGAKAQFCGGFLGRVGGRGACPAPASPPLCSRRGAARARRQQRQALCTVDRGCLVQNWAPQPMFG